MAPVRSSVGSVGNDVQHALNQAGGSVLPKLTEDGVQGPRTTARIIEFQRSKGLEPDGIAGPRTRAALGLSGASSLTPSLPSVPGGLPVNSGAIVSTVVAATRSAFGSWKLNAMFRSIRIFGPIASGGRGCLTGPSLIALITARIGALQGDDQAIAQAAAVGIDRNFTLYQDGVTVPGLPWYPAFAAFPGPVAPPTPNLPSPLLALPSAGMTGITIDQLLRLSMEQAAGSVLTAKAGPTFAAIATQVAQFFSLSISSTSVSRVLGTGPVPSFAPPASPVGAVINGTVISQPGHLS